MASADAVNQAIRAAAARVSTPPAVVVIAPPAEVYWARNDIMQALMLNQSDQPRRHGTARISPASSTEATTVTVSACHAAMPSRGTRTGQDARGSHQVPMVAIATAYAISRYGTTALTGRAPG
jgi:hypothetical protein